MQVETIVQTKASRDAIPTDHWNWRSDLACEVNRMRRRGPGTHQIDVDVTVEAWEFFRDRVCHTNANLFALADPGTLLILAVGARGPDAHDPESTRVLFLFKATGFPEVPMIPVATFEQE